MDHAPVLIPLLIALGLTAGFMAGLLGIGGGIILVPGLYFIFKTLGYNSDILMHLAVGTSLAIIIPTGISSAFTHHRKGAVRLDLVKSIGPGIVLGVVIGTIIAHLISGQSLTFIFGITLTLFALLMLIPPKQYTGAEPWGLRQPFATLGGSVIGIMSSLMGIGGATLNVPFMTFNGVGIHQAVGSSSAMGPFIALPGTIGFMVIGWNIAGLPPLSFGYVNLAALVIIAPLSVVAAPFGARLAHRVSVRTLRCIFAVFIIIVAIKMLVEAFNA